MAFNSKPNVVLITGASRGIGEKTSYEFAKNGDMVILTYNKSKSECESVKKTCESLGAKEVMMIHLDLKDNNNIKGCVKEVLNKFGHIDILINNSGVIAWKPLKEQSFDDIENQLRTNLEGLIKFTCESLHHIKKMIINVSSGAGKNGFAGLTTYCATKFGVRGFTQSLARERPKLKVYSVNPGMTKTQMTNFQGDPPEKISSAIFQLTNGELNVESGGDIDLWG